MPIGPIEKKCDAVIRLTKSQQARLGEIAGALHCYSGSGPTTGQPSWRTMVGGIADGVLRVTNPKAIRTDPERKSKKAGKKQRKECAPIPGAPKWWKPWYGNAMGEEYARKESGLTLPEILALGLRSEFNPRLPHQAVIVGLPEWPAAFSGSRPHWWWDPDNDGAMTTEAAIAVSGLTVKQIADGGMIIDDEIERVIAPEGWAKWQFPARAAAPPSADVVIIRPEWFENSPTGLPMMTVENAIAVSGMTLRDMRAHGLQVINHNGQRLVTGPAGSDWDFNALCPP